MEKRTIIPFGFVLHEAGPLPHKMPEINILEKPEQATSEVKLSGMEPMVRLVVYMAWMRLGCD